MAKGQPTPNDCCASNWRAGCGKCRRCVDGAVLVTCKSCQISAPAGTWAERNAMGRGNGLERRCPCCLTWQFKGMA